MPISRTIGKVVSGTSGDFEIVYGGAVKPDFYLVVAGEFHDEVESLSEARKLIQELVEEGIAFTDDCTVYGIYKENVFSVSSKIKFHKNIDNG